MFMMGWGVVSPLSAAFISLTSPTVSPKPLQRVEASGTGVVSFSMQETSDGIAPAKDMFGESNIKISVEFNKLALTGADVSGITGDMMDYFEAKYNADAKRLTLLQIKDYPAFGSATINIPVTVTENSLVTDNSLNGFNANISANDADTTAAGNAAEFTFTTNAPILNPEITSMDGVNKEKVLTNNNKPLIAGTCTAGNEVTLTINKVVISPTATCTAENTFSITPDTEIREGSNNLIVTQKDPDGQVSPESQLDILIVDVTSPTKPTITITEDNNNDGQIDSSEAQGDVDVKVDLAADAKVDDTLTITDANGREIQSLPITQDMISNGYTFTVPTLNVGETLTLNAKVTDLAGNVSKESNDSATFKDTTPPKLTLDTVDGKRSPVHTSNTKPAIAGSCEDGATITAYVDGVAVNPTAVCANGSYTITPTNGISDGSHAVTTEAVDNAGNKVKTPAITVVLATEDTDGDIIPDATDLDDDNDGILDTVEEATSRHGLDTDQDGIVDSKDLDSDNDGINDLLESGQDAARVDTDNDGVLDDTTDTNHNGVVDSVDASQVRPVDTDNDSVPDFQDADSDNDGILDEIEGTVDTDNDGKPNYRDTDSDNDGISDQVEGTVDTDSDGQPNYLDSDSDNDGIDDKIEGTIDTDKDGTPNYLDEDSDNDGISDKTEGSIDTDNDGKANYVDTDSDNDQESDADEGTDDRDNDGIENYIDADDHDDSDGDNILDTVDLDDDNDGILDTVEEATALNNGDTDKDGVVDSKDTDSDNDGISDIIESGQDADSLDTNNDGVLDDTTDTNKNGVMDSVEDANVVPVDTDNDNLPDFQDTDSDNDGIDDKIEGTKDTDNDGIPNYLDEDSDNDGISDKTETADDYDKDGTPNYLDTDSDNDNLLDKDEGEVDADNNGKPDYLDKFVSVVTPPVTKDLYANDDKLSVNHYGENVGYVSPNDSYIGGNSIWEIEIEPKHGEVIMDQATGRYTYSPDANYNGKDSFTYRLRDANGKSVSASVAIDVHCAASQTSDNGDALSLFAMLMMMFMTGMTGLYFIRKEKRGEA